MQSFRETFLRKKAVAADQVDLAQVIYRKNAQLAELIGEEQVHLA